MVQRVLCVAVGLFGALFPAVAQQAHRSISREQSRSNSVSNVPLSLSLYRPKNSAPADSSLLLRNGSVPLWYVRSRSSRLLSRSQLTIVLAAMHRLSEICRYRPSRLVAVMNGPTNWLLHEFIVMSPAQFFDEVGAEITGHQFLIPNVRTPV